VTIGEPQKSAIKIRELRVGLLPSQRSRRVFRDIADRARHNVDALSLLNYNRLSKRITQIIEPKI